MMIPMRIVQGRKDYILALVGVKCRGRRGLIMIRGLSVVLSILRASYCALILRMSVKRYMYQVRWILDQECLLMRDMCELQFLYQMDCNICIHG